MEKAAQDTSPILQFTNISSTSKEVKNNADLLNTVYHLDSSTKVFAQETLTVLRGCLETFTKSFLCFIETFHLAEGVSIFTLLMPILFPTVW